MRIVFDGPPGPEAGRFVEVEDDAGRSINAGTWHKRDDGLWELHIQGPTPELPAAIDAAMNSGQSQNVGGIE